jgi:hypothetical protein
MHPIRPIGVILFLLFWFIAAGQLPARADQLVLTNGDRISGKLITFSEDLVRIETQSAGIIQLERKYVARLSLDEKAAVDLVSGERINGRIVGGEGRSVVIQSSILGERTLSIDKIKEIHVGPAGQDRSSVELSGVVGKGVASASSSQASKPAEAQKPKTIGQKPEDETDIRKIFLRQTTVLLHPGQIEIEAAPGYTRNQASSPILNAKLRQFRIPFSARIGLFNRAEMYVTVPAVYVRQEFAFAENAVSRREFGTGDAIAGLNLEIARETARRPDFIAFAGVSAPTGSKPNEKGLSLGSGHWEASFGVQLIKTVDPVALFAGVYYSHQFEARYFINDGVGTVNPGEIAGYNFGFGFAVNENVSLSAQVSGSYQSNAQADGMTVFGSSSEPVSLRSALTYRYSRSTYVEPAVTIGLDDETPDFTLGISVTHRFGK